MAADSIRLRQAVREALEQGFRREVAENEEQEVNLVLLEREKAEKKTKAALQSALDTLRRLLSGSGSTP